MKVYFQIAECSLSYAKIKIISEFPLIITCFFADTGKKVGVLCMIFVVYAAKRYEECLLFIVFYLYTRFNEYSLYNKGN